MYINEVLKSRVTSDTHRDNLYRRSRYMWGGYSHNPSYREASPNHWNAHGLYQECFINPHKITHYGRTKEQLELFLIFCILAAGKSADMAKDKAFSLYFTRMEYYAPNTYFKRENNYFKIFTKGMTERLVARHVYIETPFDKFRIMLGEGDKAFEAFLRIHATGTYSKLMKTFPYLARKRWDLSTVTVEQLTSVPGIGPKTAKFFILHSRRNVQNMAVLDTHVLKYLNDKGYEGIPSSTPRSGKKYDYIQNLFLNEYEQHKKTHNHSMLTVQEFDLAIWKFYNFLTKGKY